MCNVAGSRRSRAALFGAAFHGWASVTNRRGPWQVLQWRQWLLTRQESPTPTLQAIAGSRYGMLQPGLVQTSVCPSPVSFISLLLVLNYRKCIAGRLCTTVSGAHECSKGEKKSKTHDIDLI